MNGLPAALVVMSRFRSSVQASIKTATWRNKPPAEKASSRRAGGTFSSESIESARAINSSSFFDVTFIFLRCQMESTLSGRACSQFCTNPVTHAFPVQEFITTAFAFPLPGSRSVHQHASQPFPLPAFSLSSFDLISQLRSIRDSFTSHLCDPFRSLSLLRATRLDRIS